MARVLSAKASASGTRLRVSKSSVAFQIVSFLAAIRYKRRMAHYFTITSICLGEYLTAMPEPLPLRPQIVACPFFVIKRFRPAAGEDEMDVDEEQINSIRYPNTQTLYLRPQQGTWSRRAENAPKDVLHLAQILSWS